MSFIKKERNILYRLLQLNQAKFEICLPGTCPLEYRSGGDGRATLPPRGSPSCWPGWGRQEHRGPPPLPRCCTQPRGHYSQSRPRPPPPHPFITKSKVKQ